MITAVIDSRYILPGTQLVTRKGSVVTVDATKHRNGNVRATIGSSVIDFAAGQPVTITV